MSGRWAVTYAHTIIRYDHGNEEIPDLWDRTPHYDQLKHAPKKRSLVDDVQLEDRVLGKVALGAPARRDRWDRQARHEDEHEVSAKNRRARSREMLFPPSAARKPSLKLLPPVCQNAGWKTVAARREYFAGVR